MTVGDGQETKQAVPKASSGDVDEDHVFGAVYMNPLALQATFTEKKRVYPVGAVIVREKLLTATSNLPEALTVMAKREEGFNPAANDWEFLVVDPQAMKVLKREKIGSCQQCHASQRDRDFVLGSYVR